MLYYIISYIIYYIILDYIILYIILYVFTLHYITLYYICIYIYIILGYADIIRLCNTDFTELINNDWKCSNLIKQAQAHLFIKGWTPPPLSSSSSSPSSSSPSNIINYHQVSSSWENHGQSKTPILFAHLLSDIADIARKVPRCRSWGTSSSAARRAPARPPWPGWWPGPVTPWDWNGKV